MSQPIRYSRFEVLQHPDGMPHVLGEDTDVAIYLARDTDSGEPAVLRVPTPPVQRNPAARHRFMEESREMAAVAHPHLAAMLHSGDTTTGAFRAMEFCDGVTLQRAIEEVGALPWQEAFRLALQLSSALESLEGCGLVNGGLRPTNIIVATGPDGHAHLKITEYGRVSEDAARDTLTATKSGFVRAPAYASPEEFLAVAPPDARSLQYSLGAVLWFCLTGGPPFTGTQFEVMFQHVNKEPDWKKLKAAPGPVLAVMKLLLAKSAADRFASPAAVTAAVRSALSGTTEGPKKLTAIETPAEGPTVLAWLKARQTLLLDEVHPLLGKVADQMDAGVASDNGALDASLERVHIAIEGWPTLSEGSRAALLRTPMMGWPNWKVKLFPAAAATSGSAGPGLQAASFVGFCHRLLTGQGKGAGRHVPTASLSEEGNAFFEKHLGTDAVRGLSCRGLLEALCEAEEVMLAPGEGLAGEDPLATRLVRKRGDEAAAGQKQEAWLAREREALEHARRDLSAQEADRARRMAEEQAHVEKLRRSLEEQKSQLEAKRREQQRLEQELQLRAQLEFQKLQEEAKARESVLQHKRAAAEEALRKREEEFRAREQERFAQLEKLKQENDVMEERVQQEYLTLRHVERRHAQLTHSARDIAVTPPAKPTVEPRTPATTHHAPTVPQTAGGIILARLTPLETPPAPRESKPMAIERAVPVRRRQKLVALLIGILIAGVMALLGAAALTLFSESGPQPQESPAEPAPVVIRETPKADVAPQRVGASEALSSLLNQARANPARKDALRAQALALVKEIAAQPAAEGASSAETLRQAAETWGLPEAWLALAAWESDSDTKLQYYSQAARLGNVHAKSLAGRLLLEQGARTRHGGILQQATAHLYEAIAAGDADAMMALGDALYQGHGLTENRVQGRALVERAAAQGHEPARAWLRGHKK